MSRRLIARLARLVALATVTLSVLPLPVYANTVISTPAVGTAPRPLP